MTFTSIPLVTKQFSKYTDPKLTYESQESNPGKKLIYDQESGQYKYVSNQLGFVVTFDPRTKVLVINSVKTYPGVMNESGYLLSIKDAVKINPTNVCRLLLSKYYDIGTSLEIAEQFYTRIQQQCDDFYIDLVEPFTFTKQSKSNGLNYNFKVTNRQVKVVFNNIELSMDDINNLASKLSKIANELYGVLTNSSQAIGGQL